MAEIQTVSTNNIPLKVNNSKSNNAKADNNKNIVINFEDLTPEEQKYETQRGELITKIKDLNEKMRGVSIANDAVIYGFTNEQLEQELSNMQQEEKDLIKFHQDSWWVKLGNKIDKFIDKLLPPAK